MLGFLTIVFSLVALDFYWTFRALRYARRLPGGRWWRVAIFSFTGVQVTVVLFIFVLRSFYSKLDLRIPTLVMATIYLWHILVLPAATVPGLLTRLVRRLFFRRPRRPREIAVDVTTTVMLDPAEPLTTRRQMLAAAALVSPPLVTGGLVGFALHQRNEFRVNDITVPIPGLPPNLDGLRIAHLSDTHVGAFTHGPMLRAVADATNKLKADLVCFTGDLIDFSLSDLPEGFDFLARLDPRHGLALCVGNHDLFQNGLEFRDRVLGRGYSLILDSTKDFTINGEVIQIIGLDWGLPTNHRPHEIPAHIARVLPMMNPSGSFPILLSHHPHAFDPAIEAGIPLTLSGHTHGGQLNLTKNIGGGAMKFKYWTGLYSSGNSRLVVSNGIGNWFPLRVNAPAEIVHITLRRANA